MDDNKRKAAELKLQGNTATSAGNHDNAIRFYSEAIELDPGNHVLWSNRSAAHAKLNSYSEALSDAEKAIKCQPDWPKGYGRKGLALTFMGRCDEAIQAYEEGLRLDPENGSLKEGLQEAQAARLASGPGAGKFFNPFGDPFMLTKLACNPKTKHLLDDSNFMLKLKRLQSNSSMLGEYIQDEQIQLALSALLGVDITTANADGSKEATPPPSRPAAKPTPKSQPMDVDMTPEECQAKEEKELGNVAYKSKNFDKASAHYNKAIELDPSNITYLLNLAAVRLEQGQLQTCVELCLKAVELGREKHADFKLIAKALSRCALAYQRMEDYEQAKNYYEKSLSEHRNPNTRTQLSEVEKKLKAMKEAAYLNPEKAEEERERGNALYKEQKFSEAVKAYTEAIRRDPKNAKTYSNRAACYTKLAAFDLGVKDCNTCISLDPTFIKGYVRKGMLYKAMRQFDKAMEAFQKAIELDENNTEAITGYRECVTSVDDQPDQVKKRALSDPEVQKILSDPGMRIILDQMQDDPEAAREHLRNPDIAAKIQKLVQSGLIAFR